MKSNACKNSALLTVISCLLLIYGTSCFSQETINGSGDQNDQLELVRKARESSNNQDWKEAEKRWAMVISLNPVNQEYLNNYGTALYSNRKYREALNVYLSHLKMGGWRPPLTAYNIARCYGLLNKKDSALHWFRTAYFMGLNFPRNAATDQDLKLIHDDPEFRFLTGTRDIKSMTREQGWSYDLDMIKNEIIRKAMNPYKIFKMEDIEQSLNAMKKTIRDKTDAQIILDLLALLKKLGDGHTLLIEPNTEAYTYTLPFQFYYYEDGLYIIATDSAHRQYLGNKVLQIGNAPVEKAFNTLTKYLSSEYGNEIWYKTKFANWLRYPAIWHSLNIQEDPKKLTLKLQTPSNEIKTVHMDASTSNVRSTWLNVPANWVRYSSTLSKEPLYLKNVRPFYWFEYLPAEKTVYFQYNSVSDDNNNPFAGFCRKLSSFIDSNDVEKLVIDLRHNGGGNSLLLTSLLTEVIATRKINQRGKLFVIVGRRTYSAAQNCATLLERFTNCIVVGEPTGSSPNFVGESRDPLTLPYSNVVVNISDQFWGSAWPPDRRAWLSPSVYFAPKFEDLKKGIDPCLEYILNVGKKGF